MRNSNYLDQNVLTSSIAEYHYAMSIIALDEEFPFIDGDKRNISRFRPLVEKAGVRVINDIFPNLQKLKDISLKLAYDYQLADASINQKIAFFNYYSSANLLESNVRSQGYYISSVKALLAFTNLFLITQSDNQNNKFRIKEEITQEDIDALCFSISGAMQTPIIDKSLAKNLAFALNFIGDLYINENSQHFKTAKNIYDLYFIGATLQAEVLPKGHITTIKSFHKCGIYALKLFKLNYLEYQKKEEPLKLLNSGLIWLNSASSLLASRTDKGSTEFFKAFGSYQKAHVKFHKTYEDVISLAYDQAEKLDPTIASVDLLNELAMNVNSLGMNGERFTKIAYSKSQLINSCKHSESEINVLNNTSLSTHTLSNKSNQAEAVISPNGDNRSIIEEENKTSNGQGCKPYLSANIVHIDYTNVSNANYQNKVGKKIKSCCVIL